MKDAKASFDEQSSTESNIFVNLEIMTAIYFLLGPVNDVKNAEFWNALRWTFFFDFFYTKFYFSDWNESKFCQKTKRRYNKGTLWTKCSKDLSTIRYEPDQLWPKIITRTVVEQPYNVKFISVIVESLSRHHADLLQSLSHPWRVAIFSPTIWHDIKNINEMAEYLSCIQVRLLTLLCKRFYFH